MGNNFDQILIKLYLIFVNIEEGKTLNYWIHKEERIIRPLER